MSRTRPNAADRRAAVAMCPRTTSANISVLPISSSIALMSTGPSSSSLSHAAVFVACASSSSRSTFRSIAANDASTSLCIFLPNAGLKKI